MALERWRHVRDVQLLLRMSRRCAAQGIQRAARACSRRHRAHAGRRQPHEMKKDTHMASQTQQLYDQDRDRIDVSEEHECRYWTEKLGVSYQVLKRVVAEVG